MSRKGNPITDSLKVAEHFDKEHKYVIRATKKLIQSAQNCAHFYYSITYTDSRNPSITPKGLNWLRSLLNKPNHALVFNNKSTNYQTV